MASTTENLIPAIPAFDGDARTSAQEQVIDQILGEVLAQIDEPSDSLLAILDPYRSSDQQDLTEMLDDFMGTLRVTILQRTSDWICDTSTVAGALYDTGWHKGITR